MTLTPEEVESFNGYQSTGLMHPFTCGTKEIHTPGADDVLVATADGLHCPSCDYTQDWAHDWMLDGGWRRVQDSFASYRSLFSEENSGK